MEIVNIECENKECSNYGKIVQFDLSDFVWKDERLKWYGINPETLFFKFPTGIHCQVCYSIVSCIVKNEDS